MNKFITAALLLFCCLFANGQDAQHFYTLAKEAYQKKDFESYYTNLKEAHRLHPYHQIILYRLGAAAVLTNRIDESFSYLRKALAIDASLSLSDNADLAAIRDRKEFSDLLSLKAELSKAVINSDTAFVLKDRTLHTEGIEYLSSTKTFLIGSIHKRKVVAVDVNGKSVDFATAPEMTSVFGLKADTKRNLLWVCSSPMEEMENYDSTTRSIVFKFDLATKQLLAKYRLHRSAVFGDLILNKQGEVFVSDSKNNIIWKVNEKSGELDSFYTSPDFWNIQGLAFTPDEKYLFISDYIKGVFRLTMGSKELSPVANPTSISMKGIDGLYVYKDGLIAIQNGVVPARVTRYLLSKDKTSITGSVIIDKAHPAFNEPTLGVVVSSTLYYIANSQWGGYKDGKQEPVEQLQDIVILKAELK